LVIEHFLEFTITITTHHTRAQFVQTLATRSETSLFQTIAEQGRIAWQRKTGYNLRSNVELARQRYKRIFSNTMKARALLV
jgi:hypothetical protein